MVRRAVKTIVFPGAARYVHGTSFHWYNGEGFENVSRVHELFPEKHLYFTEGCIEHTPRTRGEWHQGERYAHQIINDMNNWCEGWIDWNMVLSVDGGPNHRGNFCDAPVMVDVLTSEVVRQSSFWYLGHFSKFVRPGFFKIACYVCANINKTAEKGQGIEATAFSKTGLDAVAVVLNRTEEPSDLRIKAFGEAADVGIPPRSISTFIVENRPSAC
jgi:glucosylceramidase